MTGEVVVAFLACGSAVGALFAVDTYFARRRARREALPPLTGHGWRGDNGD